ncbi:MAG: RnfABCDGE type electron transport complex subunit D, partial [Clostridia bacterium]|nr:RnfABCDGE type electron transport complex subunit D [Clostridia bacterium]
AVFFLASDPVTSPVSPMGRFVYGALGGALAIVFRMYIPFADGVYIAVLAANILARPIDMLTAPRVFGSKTKIEK